MRGTVDQVVSIATAGAKLMTALLVIGTICTGITLFATLTVVIVGFWRVLVIVSLIFSLIAASVLPLFAVVTTGIIVGGRMMLEKQVDAFGIQTKEGGPFIAMSWVAAVASMVASTYWFSMWFVSYRRTAFSRRKRTESEIGNWKGIFREVKGDLKTWEGEEK